ncbi:hypothetical protein [Streptomyces sp. NPDC059224]|uniref:hypothetical protein n=1 Tax=Streptomyces sp. NPDC059224 TaxID=3346775 RepID=UPI0036B7FC89
MAPSPNISDLTHPSLSWPAEKPTSEPTGKGAALAALEYAWITDEMPSSLSTVDQVRSVAR